MLPVAEAAACHEHRHVAVVVIGGVAEVAGEQHGGAVEQAGAVVVAGSQVAEEGTPGGNDGFLDNCELGEFLFIAPVVAEVVVAVVDTGQRDHASAATEVVGDVAGGVGLQREANHVAHQHLSPDEVVGIADIDRFGGVDVRLGAAGPCCRCLQPTFEFTDTCFIGIEPVAVASTEFATKAAGVIRHEIHDASPLEQPLRLTCLLSRRVVYEELHVEPARRGLRRNHAPLFGVGRAVAAAAGEHERGEAGVVSAVLGHELIERDAVFPPTNRREHIG